MDAARRAIWDQIEAKWLEALLVESREPNPDPVVEMMVGVAEFRHNLQRVGLDPGRGQIDCSEDAWDVICRSPMMRQAVAGSGQGPFGYWPLNQFMGVPITLDGDLFGGVIVFRDSSGDPVRLVILTDR